MANILVIDDDPHMRDLYVEMLHDDYPHILKAANGKDGMDLCERNTVDLVITDMIMPEQDGLNTILELKHLFPHIKIIAVSGEKSSLYRAHFFGADAILTKPLDPKKLAEAINGVGL